MRKLLYLLPNVLTLISLFLGFSSILFSLQAINDLYLSALRFSTAIVAYPQQFLALAGLSIFLASIFDFLDGFTARYLKASTPMGKQLDSLVDFVSFGLAPAVLFFTVTIIATEYVPETGIDYFLLDQTTTWLQQNVIFLKLLAFILPSCTVFRLARFNLIQEKRAYFEGLPSTYVGAILGITLTFNFYLTPLTWLSHMTIPPFFLALAGEIEKLFFNYFFLSLLYVLLSFLMVTRIRFYKLESILGSFKMKRYFVVPFIIIALLSVLFFKYAFFLVGIGYVLYAMLYAILNINRLAL